MAKGEEKSKVAVKAKVRCRWAGSDPLYLAYHDEEWGVPQHDERRLFELLTLEGAQAGLSWITILRKRARYRELFDGFEAEKVARYTPHRIEALLRDPGIVRNRAKVKSAVRNAQAALRLREEPGGLDGYLWRVVGGGQRQNRWRTLAQVPAETAESRAMSKDLRRRGFTFVGPTICYAFMQATGMVNDHVVSCFRHSALRP